MIKFPKVHIAASVLSRIMDVRDELERGDKAAEAGAPLEVPPPIVPDPAITGAVLDIKTNEPPPGAEELPPVEMPEPPPDELASMIARGENLIT